MFPITQCFKISVITSIHMEINFLIDNNILKFENYWSWGYSQKTVGIGIESPNINQKLD